MADSAQASESGSSPEPPSSERPAVGEGSTPRELLVTALRNTADAVSDARKVLKSVEETLQSRATALENGADILATFQRSGVKDFRDDWSGALARISETRHQVRVVLVAELDRRGLNARQISEIWGFSRQRAASLIKEVGESSLN